MKEPRTLQQAIRYFSDSENCVAFLASRRWPNGVSCPRCGTYDVTYMKSRQLWQCKARHPKAQFSVKVGTVFEGSALALDKWLLVIWLIANERRRVPCREFSELCGTTQKSVWYLLHRISSAIDEAKYTPVEKFDLMTFDFQGFFLEAAAKGEFVLPKWAAKVLFRRKYRPKPVYRFQVPAPSRTEAGSTQEQKCQK